MELIERLKDQNVFISYWQDEDHKIGVHHIMIPGEPKSYTTRIFSLKGFGEEFTWETNPLNKKSIFAYHFLGKECFPDDAFKEWINHEAVTTD